MSKKTTRSLRSQGNFSQKHRQLAFSPASDQMKAWSVALVSELRDWPKITQKPFFGFTALYRGKVMFGLLPRTKSILQKQCSGAPIQFHEPQY
jgi:hypothetical protein